LGCGLFAWVKIRDSLLTDHQLPSEKQSAHIP